ncbi:MAG: flagellar biosynthetic protein FliO [Succinivibrio sp.]|jgi:flagellar protein FliO/FliZ|nr:flagellar biosynthetic protein FliO [Succinivibrio sp.]
MTKFLCLSALLAALPAFAAEQEEGSRVLGTGQLVSWLLSTLAVIALIVILAWGVKKTRFRFQGGGRYKIVSQLALGPKERLVEVKAGERTLLLGVTASQISLIADLTDGGFKQALAKETAASQVQGGEGTHAP